MPQFPCMWNGMIVTQRRWWGLNKMIPAKCLELIVFYLNLNFVEQASYVFPLKESKVWRSKIFMHFVDANLCVYELVTNQPSPRGTSSWHVTISTKGGISWWLVVVCWRFFSLGCKNDRNGYVVVGMASWGQLQPPDAIHYPDMKKKKVLPSIASNFTVLKPIL